MYALIKAARLASPILTWDDCQKVCLQALRWLHKRKGFLGMLNDGLPVHTLLSLYRAVFQVQWPHITLRRAFPRKPKSAKEFWSGMEKEASLENQGMLIGIEGRRDHWSVVRKITDKTILLFDSNAMDRLHRSRCGYSEEQNMDYLIGPRYVLLLRFEHQQ